MNINTYRAHYSSLDFTKRLGKLKDTYFVYHKGGYAKILAAETCNSCCSLFLVAYVYCALFVIDWENFIKKSTKNEGVIRIRDDAFSRSSGNVFSFFVVLNVVITAIIVLWSVAASAIRVFKAKKIEQTILRDFGEWPSNWKTIPKFYIPGYGVVKSTTDQTHAFLCEEVDRMKIILKILNIDPSSHIMSRYLTWAIESSLCINRNGIIMEDSNVNFELFTYTLDPDASSKRIKTITFFMLFASPFFIIYYTSRTLVNEFHKYKTNENYTRGSWTVGAKYALRKNAELQHEFKMRLGKVHSKIETIKQFRSKNIYTNHIITFVQFALATFLFTSVVLNMVAIEEGMWNETLGLLTAALSTTVVFSNKMNDTKNIDRVKIKKWENKISQKFGISCIYIEKFLVSRPVHVIREFLGIMVSPFILICKVLPRVTDVRNGIGLNNPNTVGDVVPFCDDQVLSDFPTNEELTYSPSGSAPWNVSDDDRFYTPHKKDSDSTHDSANDSGEITI